MRESASAAALLPQSRSPVLSRPKSAELQQSASAVTLLPNSRLTKSVINLAVLAIPTPEAPAAELLLSPPKAPHPKTPQPKVSPQSRFGLQPEAKRQATEERLDTWLEAYYTGAKVRGKHGRFDLLALMPAWRE